MSPHIWLSILLPVYNVEAYLAECVTSIMQQVGDDIGVQIVIVDDASSDGSWAVAARLRNQYPQWVKLIGLDVNHGVSTARNRLIAEAEGEYIWFVDSDDYLLPGAISGLRTILAEHNPDLILCDYRRNHFVKRRSFYGPTRQISCDIGQLQPSNAYYVSDFCAKEFVKIGLRFARAADVDPSLTLRLYLDLFEKCSPFTFDHLTIEYLKRLRFVRYVLLKYAMHVANASKKSTEGDNGRAQ